MTNKEILKYIDHTLLTPNCTSEDIFKLAEEAARYEMAAICIPPRYVSEVFMKLPFVNICTVVGFPLGYSSTDVKRFETRTAIDDGASEIDMVVNLIDVKDGNFDKITEEIKAVKAVCRDKILKVIIETCYLTKEEKIELCKCVVDGGADYIKTSTGFGESGASLDDILLFQTHLGDKVKIKASGGIKTRQDIERYINLGASRIGTSSVIKALTAVQTVESDEEKKEEESTGDEQK